MPRAKHALGMFIVVQRALVQPIARELLVVETAGASLAVRSVRCRARGRLVLRVHHTVACIAGSTQTAGGGDADAIREDERPHNCIECSSSHSRTWKRNDNITDRETAFRNVCRSHHVGLGFRRVVAIRHGIGSLFGHHHVSLHHLVAPETPHALGRCSVPQEALVRVQVHEAEVARNLLQCVQVRVLSVRGEAPEDGPLSLCLCVRCVSAGQTSAQIG